MHTRKFEIYLWMVLGGLISGCAPAQQGGPRIETTPVTGIVEVDGEPAENLLVECHPLPGTETIKYPLTALTDAEGRFSMSMYQAGDGLPEGTYNLAFVWEEMGIPPKDRLKGAYADPKKSKHQLTVVSGESNDIGLIELSTKGAKP
ncbi:MULTISPECIES: hypothetical protein [unclassified Schlesneria]|uniref:hypothetical protein n=1 Tax=Schlesneria TaxID=656899 RepID=UPI00359FB360